MNIQISSDAVAWYKNELDLAEGSYVRFFTRYGGSSTIQTGFSLGISIEEPVDVGTLIEKGGITFYIEEKDLWYFDGHNLLIEWKKDANEPVFRFTKTEEK
ncbi:HesB/YadR/YfhF family protein [Bacillota bacterium Lsc_1132]